MSNTVRDLLGPEQHHSASSRDPRRFPHTGPLYPGPIFPGNGYPANPGEDRPGGSPFGRLAKGQPLGKTTYLVYHATGNVKQPSQSDMLRVEGDDLDACQMIITLTPPSVIALPFAEALAIMAEGKNLTGEQDSGQIGAGHFPGLVTPVEWPPIEAIIEWGTKGCSAKAVVDYTNGVTFSVTGSFVKVSAAVTQSLASGDITGTPAVYVVGANIAPGYSRDNPKRTMYIGSFADSTESSVYQVPKFAKRAYLVGCDETTPPAITAGWIRFWQRPDGTSNVGNLYQSGNQPSAFDVPAGAAYFNVYNQSGTTMRMSVIFELALS